MGSSTEMEARIEKLEVSLQELQEEVMKMRPSTPPDGHHAAASPPSLPVVQLEAEALDPGNTHGDAKVGRADSGVDEWESYEFQRSIWDASIFIGLPPIGRLGSAMVGVLLLLTVAMQLMFCTLINDHLTSALIDEAKVEELRTWRVSHAHNIRYMDPISTKSMARQVCDKESIIWSEGTRTLLVTIDEYMGLGQSDVVLGPLFPNTSGVGAAMCVIALLLWYMTLLKDFEAARALTLAMRLMPRGPNTRLSASGGSVTVECLSQGRFCIVLSTVLVRCFVHLVLLWSGSLFLVYTISLSDLILNAVALEVVLTLDSVVYEAFAPHDSKKLIGSLSPLPKPRQPSYKGVDAVSGAGFTCAISLAIVMLFVFLIPQVGLLREARDVLCGGNVDFVATFGNHGLLVVHPSSVQETPSSSVDSYNYHSMSEAILNQDGLNGLKLSYTGLGVRGSPRSVEGMRDMGVARATSVVNVVCRDFDSEHVTAGPAEEALLRSLFGLDSSVSINEFCPHPNVRRECPSDTPNGLRARQYCPVTCGCANPAGTLVIAHPDGGCPYTCTQVTSYKEKTKNCTDDPTDSTAWQDYYKGLQLLNASWVGRWQQFVTAALNTLDVVGGFSQTGGCSVVNLLMNAVGVDLCDSENAWGFKPLTHVCSVTCSCKAAPGQIGCPSSCADG